MFEEFIGTKPVSEQQKVDTEALAAYLKQHVPGFAGTLQLERTQVDIDDVVRKAVESMLEAAAAKHVPTQVILFLSMVSPYILDPRSRARASAMSRS